MEKPVVWSHKYRSRLGEREGASFLICLSEDKEALSVHVGPSNLLQTMLMGVGKYLLCGAEWQGHEPGVLTTLVPAPTNPSI